jgi:hypothetical protein
MATIQGDGYSTLKEFYARPLTQREIGVLGIKPKDLESLITRQLIMNIDKTHKTPVYQITPTGRTYVEEMVVLNFPGC